MAAPKAPSPEDDVWQAADKYHSIVHYMAEYTNQLLKCSRDGELFITDHLSNVLGHLEIKMMELAGEDGFNSFVIETLDELKSGILGNICQTREESLTTSDSVPTGDVDFDSYLFDHADAVMLPSPEVSQSWSCHLTESRDPPSTVCLYRQHTSSPMDAQSSRVNHKFQQPIESEDSAGSECSTSVIHKGGKGRWYTPTGTVDCALSDCENSDDGWCGQHIPHFSDENDESEEGDNSDRKPTHCKSNAKKSKRLNKSATEFLTKWLIDHQDNPFPSADEKVKIAKHLGLHPQQVGNWMTNMRKRHLYPVIAGKRAPKTALDFAVLERHFNPSSAESLSQPCGDNDGDFWGHKQRQQLQFQIHLQQFKQYQQRERRDATSQAVRSIPVPLVSSSTLPVVEESVDSVEEGGEEEDEDSEVCAILFDKKGADVCDIVGRKRGAESTWVESDACIWKKRSMQTCELEDEEEHMESRLLLQESSLGSDWRDMSDFERDLWITLSSSPCEERDYGQTSEGGVNTGSLDGSDWQKCDTSSSWFDEVSEGMGYCSSLHSHASAFSAYGYDISESRGCAIEKQNEKVGHEVSHDNEKVAMTGYSEI